MKRFYTVILILLTINLFADVTVYTPALKAPSDGATKQVPDVLLDWEPVTGNIGLHYEVLLALDEAFTNPTMFSTDVTSVNASELLFNTEYFWKVRAIDNTGTSGWSETRSFTVLELIDLDKPNNNADDQAPNVALIWKEITGLTFYELQLDVTPDFNSPDLIDSMVPFTVAIDRITCADLFFGTTYYWRVRGMHSKDTCSWSTTRNFATLVDFKLRKPNNNAVDRMPDEQLKWDAVPGTLGFIYQVATTNTFTDAITYNTTANTVNVDTLNFGVKYYWRVKVYHSKDTTDWSEVRNFTVINQVILTTPVDGEVGLPLYPLFSWEAISGITTYEINISISPEFLDGIVHDVLNTNPPSTQEFQLPSPALDSATVYYWRVRAQHQRDTSDWSEVWSFTVLGTGIESLQLNDHLINIYPNPCAERVFLKMKCGKTAEIRITLMNLAGQDVIDETFHYNQGTLTKSLEVGNLPDGIYLMRLETDRSVLTKKLIIHD